MSAESCRVEQGRSGSYGGGGGGADVVANDLELLAGGQRKRRRVQPPAASPSPSFSPVLLSCPACTLLNPAGRLLCRLCDSPLPAAAAPASLSSAPPLPPPPPPPPSSVRPSSASASSSSSSLSSPSSSNLPTAVPASTPDPCAVLSPVVSASLPRPATPVLPSVPSLVPVSLLSLPVLPFPSPLSPPLLSAARFESAMRRGELGVLQLQVSIDRRTEPALVHQHSIAQHTAARPTLLLALPEHGADALFSGLCALCGVSAEQCAVAVLCLGCRRVRVAARGVVQCGAARAGRGLRRLHAASRAVRPGRGAEKGGRGVALRPPSAVLPLRSPQPAPAAHLAAAVPSSRLLPRTGRKSARHRCALAAATMCRGSASAASAFPVLQRHLLLVAVSQSSSVLFVCVFRTHNSGRGGCVRVRAGGGVGCTRSAG